MIIEAIFHSRSTVRNAMQWQMEKAQRKAAIGKIVKIENDETHTIKQNVCKTYEE